MSDDTFRACMIPGQPLTTLLPFQSEPEERNLHHAQELSLAAAAGLWKLAEHAYSEMAALHQGGLAHGDAELHNFVVCPSPLAVLLVDFEAAQRQAGMQADAWLARCQSDLDPLLRLAVLFQCRLGAQPAELAERAAARAGAFFRDAARFARAIERRSEVG
jgi:hypothetical protein